MLISIVVKPNAKHPSVEKMPDGSYKVAVKAPAQEGKANEAVRKILAEHFSLPQSDVKIVRGFKGKKKWVEIQIAAEKQE